MTGEEEAYRKRRELQVEKFSILRIVVPDLWFTNLASATLLVGKMVRL